MDSINNACKLGSDAWLELQAFKTRQLNRRERLNRHKDILVGISHNNSSSTASSSSLPSAHPTTSAYHNNNNITQPSNDDRLAANSVAEANLTNHRHLTSNAKLDGPPISSKDLPSSHLETLVPVNIAPETSDQHLNQTNNSINVDLVECLLLLKLCDVALRLPIDSKSLQCSINRIKGLESATQSLIENLLQKFAHQELITIEEPSSAIFSKRRTSHHLGGGPESLNEDGSDDACIYVTSADHTKLVEFDKSFSTSDNIRALLLDPKSDQDHQSWTSNGSDTHSLNTAIRPLAITHRKSDFDTANSLANSARVIGQPSTSKHKAPTVGEDLESLLSLSSTRERESKKLGEELLELLSKPTAKEKNLLESFRSADGYQVQEFCPKGTKDECRRNSKESMACSKLHFKKIIAKHTEESLGDCSFLNTCFHMDSCKYVHYKVDYDDQSTPITSVFKRPYPTTSIVNSSNQANNISSSNKRLLPNQILPSGVSLNSQQATNLSQLPNQLATTTKDTNNNKSSSTTIASATINTATTTLSHYTGTTSSAFPLNQKPSASEQARIDAKNHKRFKTVLYPPQWIQCDLRFFDMSLLGKFSVVMADPPWDIHMELPYGTMSDEEMCKLNIPALQDEGVIFLWVTGRAMELGRECLALWGYERCDEIIWVKTNQLQRIIRTGRTGHWLNHGKEHCLVGVKGNPKDINRGLDCDVIVAEVRATSHKPDEIYGIIERLSPGTRKIELFGRAHNVQPNWITLGNQLNGVRLMEPNLISVFKKLNLPFQTGDGIDG